jgi:putative transposase
VGSFDEHTWRISVSAISVFIDPGSPWQNTWIESFNGRFRDELLNNSWQFDSLREARVIIEYWRIDYNWQRPHTAHGDLTPADFAATWTTNQPEPHSPSTTHRVPLTPSAAVIGQVLRAHAGPSGSKREGRV